ncbi:MAG: HU family DNA-binding protein [Chitinophagaceae bacterium]|nr:HU family DNA-binding protein [Chitinophagaceae bacterium]
MTKLELLHEISERTGIERRDVTAAVEACFLIIKEKVAKGEEINIRGFGTFLCKKRKPKIARDIKKGEPIILPEKNMPVFKASDIFIDMMKKL